MSTITLFAGSKSFGFEVQNATQIPQCCMRLVTQLVEQPLFTGIGSTMKECKVLTLDNWIDVKMFDVFSHNAQKIIGNRSAWHIHQFGGGDDVLRNSSGKSIGHGLALWLYDSVEPCSIADLEKTYNRIFNNITAGWVRANIEEYPDMMFKEDPDEFELFIKKEALPEEEQLICCIAIRFGFKNDVRCHSRWSYGSSYEDKGIIYQWIRKKALEKVVEKLGFKLFS
jgi:hypothetical protein